LGEERANFCLENNSAEQRQSQVLSGFNSSGLKEFSGRKIDAN
jgi:hypothetical protein